MLFSPGLGLICVLETISICFYYYGHTTYYGYLISHTTLNAKKKIQTQSEPVLFYEGSHTVGQ